MRVAYAFKAFKLLKHICYAHKNVVTSKLQRFNYSSTVTVLAYA